MGVRAIRSVLLALLTYAGASAGTEALCFGQEGLRQSPLEAATASPADKPLTVHDEPDEAKFDEDAGRLFALLCGSFVSEAGKAGEADSPALVMHGAAITVKGLERSVLLEVARKDAPAEPFRTSIVSVYRRQGELRVRMFDLPGGSSMREALAGLWASPTSIPAFDLANLSVVLEIPVKRDGEDGSFGGKTPMAYPTTRDGAIEIVSSILVNEIGIKLADAGFDATGNKVWGQDASSPTVFTRTTGGKAPVTRSAEGLVVITTVPPAAGATALIDNGEITVHYSGWLTSGMMFDSSRLPNREPFRVRLPGPVIKGWNEGLKGIAKGERRRLVIPPALGYAERGAGRVIPPGATLIFDVECLHVDNTQPAPPPTQPPINPFDKPAEQPAGSGEAVGKPATGSTPEKPR